MIDRTRESQLIAAARDGDSEAITALAKMHAGVLHKRFISWASRFHHSDEEIAAGVYSAIWTAAQTFDPARGFRFTTHLQWRMRFELSRLKRWKQGGKKASRITIFEATDLVLAHHASDSGRKASVLDDIDRTERIKAIREAIAKLPERLGQVIAWRMDGCTLKEIGQRLEGRNGAMTRERVRQLEAEGINMLRTIIQGGTSASHLSEMKWLQFAAAQQEMGGMAA